MKKYSAYRLLYVLIFAVIFFALAGCREQQKDDSLSGVKGSSVKKLSESAVAHVKKSNEPVKTIPVLGWVALNRYKYSVKLESALLLGSQPVMDFSISGQLVIDGAKKGSGGDEFACFFKDVKVDFKSGKNALKQENLLKNSLEQQPVWVTFREGALKSIFWAQPPNSFMVGIWRSVLGAFQLSLNIDESGRDKSGELKTVEFDNNGRYEAVYTQNGKSGWSKKKLAYINGLYTGESNGMLKEAPRPRLIMSSWNMRFNNGIIDSVSQKEQVKVVLTGTGAFMGTTALSIKYVSGARLSKPPLADLKNGVTLEASEPFIQKLPVDAMDRQRMEGLTFKKLLDALVDKSRDPRKKRLWRAKNDKAADKKQQKDADRWTKDWSVYFAALPAFFRQQPKTIKIAEKEIIKGSPATSSLLGGLASSATLAAQKTLLKLAENSRLDDTVREAAMRNLVQCRSPFIETSEAVKKFYNKGFLASYAVYGTGIIARKLRESGEFDKAAESVRWLAELLKKEKNSDRRRDIFRGLANSAHPLLLEITGNYLNSSDPSDRAGAIDSLRLVKNPGVDKIIIKALDYASEPEKSVRIAAINALSVREKSSRTISTLIKTAQEDPESRVKSAARKLLYTWAKNDNALQQQLLTINWTDLKTTDAK